MSKGAQLAPLFDMIANENNERRVQNGLITTITVSLARYIDRDIERLLRNRWWHLAHATPSRLRL